MHTQSEMREPSEAQMSNGREAEIIEEDNFMIRHGWYLSCFYEPWLNSRSREVERKRATERAKYMKLYKNSTMFPTPHRWHQS